MYYKKSGQNLNKSEKLFSTEIFGNQGIKNFSYEYNTNNPDFNKELKIETKGEKRISENQEINELEKRMNNKIKVLKLDIYALNKKNIALQQDNIALKKINIDLKIDNNALHGRINQIQNENENMKIRIKNEELATAFLNEKNNKNTKLLKSEINTLKKDLNITNEKTEYLKAIINLIIYRDSIKKLLYLLLEKSKSNLKNRKDYTYKELASELEKFIKSTEFKLNYFIDKNGMFRNFIIKMCNLVDDLNSVVHEGEENYLYSFSDFINAYNIYVQEKKPSNRISYEDENLIGKHLKKLDALKFFL